METQKVRLTAEKETLLVPLLGKAAQNRWPHPILADPKAEEILEGIEYDFAALNAPAKTLTTLAMRAKKLDSYVREYLERVDDPLVLHLGCGLDSRVLRVGSQRGSWYDIDFPEVIELRRHFYQESDVYHMIGSSVTAPDLLGHVKESGRPACVVAEGLLMYLHEAEVKALFLDIQRRFPGSEISFDAFSALTARSANRHPSIKKTGARLHWGIDDAREIETWAPGIRLVEEWYFADSEDIPFLGAGDRFMFRTMGMLPIAKKAHRILHFTL